jgi:hypothetical protein
MTPGPDVSRCRALVRRGPVAAFGLTIFGYRTPSPSPQYHVPLYSPLALRTRTDPWER